MLEVKTVSLLRSSTSLRNRSRGRLLCTVSYRSYQFERQTEGTFRTFFASIHPKKGLKVRMMALLWRSQFLFVFRRERFAPINGRFSVMGIIVKWHKASFLLLTRKGSSGR